MTEVHNLKANITVTFSHNVPSLAVQYCRAEEAKELTLFHLLSQDGRDERWPVREGARSVSCGDWAALK